jgi:probable HAF family extracellular repeat protein
MFLRFFSNWLKAVNRRSPGAPWRQGVGKRRTQPRVAPQVEVLEDRTVPSGGYVFHTIDDPLGVQGSAAFGINSSGKVVGDFTDANSVTHGYLLSGGHYTTIDDPSTVGVTNAFGINASGKIVGQYLDANGLNHGFLLSGGHFTTLDNPNAGTGTGQGTTALGINASGSIVGNYTDANGLNHGFLFSGGRYTTLDDSNAGTGTGQGTFAEGINASGRIVGQYIDANGLVHGFLLRDGQYTTRDDPTGVQGSGADGNNDSGQVAGFSFDANGVLHGYLLSGSRYTTFDDPAGVKGSAADAISDTGQVVGEYFDANGVVHGYLATKHDQSALAGPGDSAIGSVATISFFSDLFAQDQALNELGAGLSSSTAYGAGSLSHEALLPADAGAAAPQMIFAPAKVEAFSSQVPLTHSARDLLFATANTPAPLDLNDHDAFLAQ